MTDFRISIILLPFGQDISMHMVLAQKKTIVRGSEIYFFTESRSPSSHLPPIFQAIEYSVMMKREPENCQQLPTCRSHKLRKY